MKTQSRDTHEECWRLLPWLANGRLAAGERAMTEEHVRTCRECAAELERERLMRAALTEPERVTHAPGPSFRKLMARIDAAPTAVDEDLPAPPRRPLRAGLAATWRPPGLAWAATFVFALGIGMLTPTFYRWSQPAYSTYTSTPRAHADVLHIAFERSLTVGEVEELLRHNGARIVEGPDNTGVFGVSLTPGSARAPGPPPGMSELAARLRADARVRWIEPLPEGARGRTPPRP